MDASIPYEDHDPLHRTHRWAEGRARMALLMARRHGRHGHGWTAPAFGRRGFGEFPGPFFGRGPKVGRGDVRAAVLALLAEGPMHGYQMIRELTERSGGLWRPSPGSIYPTLQLLEDEGLIRGEQLEGRRVFRLTEAGEAETVSRDEAAAPWEMFGDVGPLVDLREVGFGVVAAVMQVAHTGREEQIARAKEILAETRKALYHLLADDEGSSE